eukprot:TRINITY_DN1250_c0_g1_i1.p2 TRINITY_DN1250_c0_g1~~TRINITY_DN1250_c0_g1_i1.p2  ORF type:complete len:166 (-),score=69.09 TRINITY_DN1250_c0_g1_i1:59-556(-)
MQTDPNWSNFLYNQQRNKIYLLDFGASREFPSRFTDEYIEVIYHAANVNREGVYQASKNLGFLTDDETELMKQAHVDAVLILGEPFRSDEPFDFSRQEITAKIKQLIPVMLKHRLTPPPPERYSLHRRLAGAYLICAKLGAVMPCRQMLLDVYAAYSHAKAAASS